MCWAAADRAATVAARYRPADEPGLRASATAIRQQIFARAWSEERLTLVGSYEGSNLDASLLQMAPLRLVAPDDPRLSSTVDGIWKGLTHGGWLMRYNEDDGFGKPTVAFTLCTFWLIEALATLGRTAEARELLVAASKSLSPLGLMSEDFDTASGRMMGNFPQAYSHVGFIRAAFAAAPPWRDVI
jgi:GH15 family glucan-1,4-alpha-glucosidase